MNSLFSKIESYASELCILLVSVVTAGGIWIFLEIADEVLEGATRRIDETILLLLRNPEDLSDPLGPAWFEGMMRDFTALGSNALLVTVSLAVLGYLLLQRKKEMAIFMTAAILGGFLLSSGLKQIFDRPRPDIVPHATYVVSASFPSGHSMLSAVVFFTLGGLLARSTGNRRMKVYILALSVLATLIVGCSRIYLGVHWPTDVLAGWTAGASWALLCWTGAILFQRRVPNKDAS